MKRVSGQRFAEYPMQFRIEDRKRKRRIVRSIKRQLYRVVAFGFEILLVFRILRRYESEYGLIVSVRQKEATGNG